MPTSSAVPADLFTYSNSCVGMDDQLQTFAVHSLGPALDAYRLRCSTFPISHSSGPGIQHGGDGYTHGYGTAFSLAGELTQYAVTNRNIDSWVGQVATAFVQASGVLLNRDPRSPAEIAALQRDLSKPSGPIDDASLIAALETPAELQAGLELANEANAQGFTPDVLLTLESHQNDPAFCAAFYNQLSDTTLHQLLDITPPSDESVQRGDTNPQVRLSDLTLTEVDAVTKSIASAYGSGLLAPGFSARIQTLLFDQTLPGNGSQFTSDLFSHVAADPVAASRFVWDLSGAQIRGLFIGNSGQVAALFTVLSHSDKQYIVSQMGDQIGSLPEPIALKMVVENIGAFAGASSNFTFTPSQLHALMKAVGRPANQLPLTQAAAQWIDTHIPPPGSDAQHFGAWAQQVKWMIQAFAQPTAADIKATVDGYGLVDALTLGFAGLVAAPVVGAVAGIVFGATAIGAGTFGAGAAAIPASTLFTLPNGSESAGQYERMIAEATKYTLVFDLLAHGRVSQVTGTDGARIAVPIPPIPPGMDMKSLVDAIVTQPWNYCMLTETQNTVANVLEPVSYLSA